jgi:hypothetical protein
MAGVLSLLAYTMKASFIAQIVHPKYLLLMNSYTSYARVEVLIDDEQFEFLMTRLSENLPEWVDSVWTTGYCQWHIATIDSKVCAIDPAGFIYAVSQILSRKHVWFSNDIWNYIVLHAVCEDWWDCECFITDAIVHYWMYLCPKILGLA